MRTISGVGVGLHGVIGLHLGQMLFELGVVFPDHVVVDDDHRRAVFAGEAMELLGGHVFDRFDWLWLYALSLIPTREILIQKGNPRESCNVPLGSPFLGLRLWPYSTRTGPMIVFQRRPPPTENNPASKG